MNKITSALIAFILAFAATACTSKARRETPVGQMCYRSFAYETHPRYYKCLFELSAPSAFYDDKAVERVLGSFMANEGGDCERRPEREVADMSEPVMDHGLSYRLFEIVCR